MKAKSGWSPVSWEPCQQSPSEVRYVDSARWPKLFRKVKDFFTKKSSKLQVPSFLEMTWWNHRKIQPEGRSFTKKNAPLPCEKLGGTSWRETLLRQQGEFGWRYWHNLSQDDARALLVMDKIWLHSLCICIHDRLQYVVTMPKILPGSHQWKKQAA